MTFINKFDTLIKKSNNCTTKISLNNGIILSNLNLDMKLLYSKKIMYGNYSFIDYWFDINEDDSIYGIVTTKDKGLFYIYITDKVIVKNNIFKYDYKLFSIKFTYIKNFNKTSHMFYYLINKRQNNLCDLIHNYKTDKGWVQCEIDSIPYNILTNFVITFEDFTPSIFYLKIINGFEELFVSTFDLNTSTWSSPLQITNSHKPKIYLCVIKDSNKHYQIVFSENNYDRYYCAYITGYIENNMFIFINSRILSNSVTCIFPNVLEHNSEILVQWIEYANLNTCTSCDYGKTWSIINDTSAELPFICCNYKSNCNSDDVLNSFVIFSYENSIDVLGTKN